MENRDLHPFTVMVTGSYNRNTADVAQLVEQSIRNRQVIGSSPIVGSSKFLCMAGLTAALHHHVANADPLHGPDGQEIGITRAGTDEINFSNLRHFFLSRYAIQRLSTTRPTSRTIPAAKVYQMSFFSMGSKGSYSLSILRNSSLIRGSVIGHPFTMGGSIPWKNSHEISRPTQMMYPKRQST